MRNRWYEIPFFLTAAFILFYPGAIASLFNVDAGYRYYFFLPGLVIYAAVIFIQKIRLTVAERGGLYMRRDRRSFL